ncbi:hypothetical protein NDU88_007400 [Pleurodeles waltl]|uniref:Uncharacterized protein n=1 Tax=Pleurodeles waltl TaxID=8319 RepID=A0AAV7SSE9_PLEWA|nr:hypothetical protein NDU88_007400 [Pleurodeles waltl]
MARHPGPGALRLRIRHPSPGCLRPLCHRAPSCSITAVTEQGQSLASAHTLDYRDTRAKQKVEKPVRYEAEHSH